MVRGILQIIPEMKVGGAEKTVLEMTEALTARGWRSLVVAKGGRLVPEIEALGGQFLAMDVATKNPIKMIGNIFRLKRLIEREEVELVHVRSRAPAWSALFACRLSGCPMVTTYHGAHSQKTALKRFYNSVMVRGDVVIANSAYTARQIKRYHGDHLRRLETINRGVDLERVNPSVVTNERKTALAARWGLKSDDRVIFMPARLSARKGQKDVIKAVGLLKKRGDISSLKVIMAGGIDGSEAYHQELLSDIAAQGLSGNIQMVGYCADMPAGFALSDVVLAVSSKPESFGRVVAESLAMGLPVVVSDVGAQPEIIEPAGRGSFHGAIKVSAHDPSAIADAIERLLVMNAQERAAYARDGRSYIEALYTTKQLQDQTIAVYERLLRVNGNN